MIFANSPRPSSRRRGDRVEAERPLWVRLDGQPRLSARDLRAIDLPTDPGVYAWYRHGRAVYMGKADDLHARVWRNHLGQGHSVGTSAFRRNVAEHLGFGSSADIKAKRIKLRADQLAILRAWILTCRVAWIVCRSTAEAVRLEARLKAEWMPPLAKR